MRLDDKVTIITGSSKGIGEGIARVFSNAGAKVVICSRNEKEGTKIAKELGKKNGSSLYIRADVTKNIDIQNMINKTIDVFGKLDILVNNAGTTLKKNAENTLEEEWDFIQATDLRSTFLCCKYAIPYLKKTKGNIINISSMAGIQGFPNSAAYSAAKGGQIALTKNIAIDYGPIGIRANVICPGYINTPLSESILNNRPDGELLRKTLIDSTPLKRFGSIEECGFAALYLASDSASFVTGVVLCIDGGVSLGY